MKPPEGSIPIFCGDPSHDPVTIAYFYPLRDVAGCWQLWMSTAGVGVDDVIETLVDDALPEPGTGRAAFQVDGVVRRRYKLPPCRKCQRTPDPMREEKLFRALTLLADNGIDTVISLDLLAATIGRMPT